jgi:adenine-specific DNA methylase
MPQVGAETQRERDTGKAPPTHRLHVWWARRPLTPSRAAILASILPADTDAGWFLKELGIQKKIVRLSGGDWVLTGPSAQLIRSENGEETLDFDERTLQALEKENSRRAESRKVIKALKSLHELGNHPVLERWEKESAPLKEPPTGKTLQVLTVAALLLT